jgi:pyruvate formate lyase activating enzyme
MRAHTGRFWHQEGGRFRCDLCPRACLMLSGQQGFCFVREATEDGIVLTTYGRASGFCLDPIETKPLFHFYPGTAALSFGTAGCNLGCSYCQNWDLSKARDIDRLTDEAAPADIARTARALGARSVAFTYNDPVIFAEYAIDTARACRDLGVKSVAVTAGYLAAAARPEFFAALDAANIDVKAFSEEFYRRRCLGHLQPVLDTVAYAVNHTRCWVELTTLLIPGLNDGDAEIDALVRWIGEQLGPDVPLHFTAFHPDYNLADVPPTPVATLRRARARAIASGLHHVYTGNVDDPAGGVTSCRACGTPLIERRGWRITGWRVEAASCPACGRELAGRFDAAPGRWGELRVPVTIAPTAQDLPAGEHETG